jgi:o-succinylbenzoate---CoA ligase
MLETNYKDIFKIDKKKLDQIDVEIFSLLEFWKSNKKEIKVSTSGSTGNPKKIKITRQQLINSAKATLKYFEIKENSTFLNCLPVKYIGGKMMIIRALIGKTNIILCKPSVIPFNKLLKEIDFIALTPLQLDGLLKNEKIFSKIRLAIIGGGTISERHIEQLKDVSTDCYQTYGMTETVSHIAVRNLKNYSENKSYKCLKNNTVTTNSNNQLIVNSKNLYISSLTTNDIAQITGNDEFIIKGRVGSIINSGGFKVSIESIEEMLSKSLKKRLFFIDHIKCDKLGEKIILIVDKRINLEEITSSINKIMDHKKRPKEIYYTPNFYYNENQKIDRLKTKKNAIQLGILYKL